MNESSSSTALLGFTSAAFTPVVVSLRATTTQVTERVPTGTTTRAPTAGVGVPTGTRYVSKLRVGTGTATWMNTGLGLRASGFGAFPCDRLQPFWPGAWSLESEACKSPRATFISSHTSRFDAGLRRRYAG